MSLLKGSLNRHDSLCKVWVKISFQMLRKAAIERDGGLRRVRGEGGGRGEKRGMTPHGIAYFRFDLKCPVITQDEV